MIKYFNPLNYLKYILRFIKSYLENRNKKLINNSDFLEKKLEKINNIHDLLDFHFKTYANPKHVNRDMFKVLLENSFGSSMNILETGSAAHGTKSSILFASYVKIFGGRFETVDINPKIKLYFSFLESSNIKFHSEDSLKFINDLEDKYINSLDLVYLDSFDLDLNNPSPSQNHGLNEFLSLNKNLKKGALIAIDDTPIRYELFGNSKKNKFDFIPGKGRLVLDFLDKNPDLYEILYHNYSVVLKKL
ncbi:MAG: hypothetical protein ACJ0QX_00230 [Gammaproteobacteria bacterium]|tara:strand:+ start:9032 stop:9772 length:741 start_codon:yes stop_codon:yes gene_type:complete